MGKLKQKLSQHFHSSWWVYIFILLCFIAGIIFGSLGVRVLNEGQSSSLLKFIEQGLAQTNGELDYIMNTRQAFVKNALNLAKILILGLTVIGVPFIMLIIFTRGFVLGFTIVFLLQGKGLLGGLLALFAVVPPNLLSLPAYLLAAVSATNFSVYLIKGRSTPGSISLPKYFLNYILVMLGLILLLVGAAFIEGYYSPVIIQLLSVKKLCILYKVCISGL